MASATDRLKKMDTLIEKLGTDTKFPIPGLNKEKILEEAAKKDESLGSYIKELEEEQKDGTKTKEEVEKEIKEVIDRYKKVIEPTVTESIAVIQTNYNLIQDSTKQLTENVASAIATTAIPPAIGAPPVAPNPAYALVENKQKKNVLLSILSTMKNALLNILTAAKKIAFALPDIILGLVDSLSTLTTVISTIP
jgi:hypothetical protein